MFPTAAPAVEAVLNLNFLKFANKENKIKKNIPPTILVRSNTGAQCTNTELIAGQNAPLYLIRLLKFKK